MKSRIYLPACYLVMISTQVQAHHSFAIYDIDNRIERTGVLTRLVFRTPHIQLEMQVTNDDGSTDTWQIESMNPARWDRAGLARDIASVGERITISGWPARNGKDEMLLSSIDAGRGRTVVLEEVRQQRAREDVPATTVKRD